MFQGYIRIAKCSLALGDLLAADNAISVIKELSPNNTAIIPEVQKLEVVRRFDEAANQAYQKQDYRKVSIVSGSLCYRKIWSWRRDFKIWCTCFCTHNRL